MRISFDGLVVIEIHSTRLAKAVGHGGSLGGVMPEMAELDGEGMCPHSEAAAVRVCASEGEVQIMKGFFSFTWFSSLPPSLPVLSSP